MGSSAHTSNPILPPTQPSSLPKILSIHTVEGGGVAPYSKKEEEKEVEKILKNKSKNNFKINSKTKSKLKLS